MRGTSEIEQRVPVADLGTRFEALRLSAPDAVRRMEQSLRRCGQLNALLVWRHADSLEVLDGFKRVRAARRVEIETLRVQTLALDLPVAKASILVANARTTVDELEEGWLIRSLYREDRLTQPEIAQLLGRHKSWVCRRLALVEQLSQDVEADLRLGLLSPTAARELVRLPRGNQRAAADVVMRLGLATRETAQLVADVLATRSDEEIEAVLKTQPRPSRLPSARPRARTPLESLVEDIASICRVSGRLQARLQARPMSALGDPGAQLVATSLTELRPVLTALSQTVDRITQELLRCHAGPPAKS